MNSSYYRKRAKLHVATLCCDIGDRCVGSTGNRQAADYAAGVMKAFGFRVDRPGFACFDWEDRGSELMVGKERFQVYSSPYTLGGEIKAPLSAAASIEELEQVEAEGRIVLLHGPVAAEQLMPKNFTFYNPEEHQKIYRLLEGRGFKAVLAATSRHPEMAGGLYPFPLIEDGDFTLPSAFMTDREGERLLDLVFGSGPTPPARGSDPDPPPDRSREARLIINTTRRPSEGCNVIARRGAGASERAVVMAHIDSKKGTPGAIDNATGTTVLFLLAEMLAGYTGEMIIELAVINGEDYYSNPGEMLYLEENRDRFDEIVLGINIDGAGYRGGAAVYSCYGCPAEITAAAREVFEGGYGIVEGDPWYQGDHGLFMYNNRPALALTSSAFEDLLQIAHTPGDKPELIDYDQVVGVAGAVHDLLIRLSESR